MENVPMDITDTEVDPDRRVTLLVLPDMTGVMLTEYLGNAYEEVSLSGQELAMAYATWYAEKQAAEYAARGEDSPFAILELDKQTA